MLKLTCHKSVAVSVAAGEGRNVNRSEAVAQFTIAIREVLHGVSTYTVHKSTACLALERRLVVMQVVAAIASVEA